MNSFNSAANIAFRISTKALWAPLLVLILHRMAAQGLGHEPYVDPVSHFAGGVAIAFFFWRSAECLQRGVSDRWIIGATILVAIAWELMEFSLSVYRGWSMYWDPLNTLRDLLLGIAGAASFIVLGKKNRAARQKSADE